MLLRIDPNSFSGIDDARRHPTWHDKAQRLFDKLTNDGSKIFHETDESPNRAVSLNLGECLAC